MLSIALIDDESSARNSARNVLHQYFPQVSIAGEAGTVAEGYELIQSTQPDVVLLDIDMPDGTGFDLLGKWKDPPFKVIFITAFDQFAVKAFQFSAFDYLLKPFDPQSLVEDIRKLLDSSAQGQGIASQQLELLFETLRSQQANRLLIPHQYGFHVVPLSDLLYIQAEGSYSMLHSKTGPTITSSRSIAVYESLLPAAHFQRVHQSYLLNLLEVRSFQMGDDMEALLSGGQKIPVSRRKKQDFLDALRRISLGN